MKIKISCVLATEKILKIVSKQSTPSFLFIMDNESPLQTTSRHGISRNFADLGIGFFSYDIKSARQRIEAYDIFFSSLGDHRYGLNSDEKRILSERWATTVYCYNDDIHSYRKQERFLVCKIEEI